ncbi:ArsR/SmtB family transcription factor [Streptomyces sp. MMS24-I2-30]|uniref:ArsR/SmtB family transcription factor n=1 Tax=Streptomyces sp. MMS24-I2-30 TaxID=3351564 RepID=UPI003896C442
MSSSPAGWSGPSAIADVCGLRSPTASEHLSLLRRGGLVVSRKDGKQVFHRADSAAMAQRLGAPKDYLARCCPPDAVADLRRCRQPRRSSIADIAATTDGATL